MGWRADFGFQIWKQKIQTKDRFFFFTDGVTEARGNSGIYGEPKLTEVLKKNIGNNLQNTSQEILIRTQGNFLNQAIPPNDLLVGHPKLFATSSVQLDKRFFLQPN